MTALDTKTAVILSLVVLTAATTSRGHRNAISSDVNVISSHLQKSEQPISSHTMGNDYSVGYTFTPQVNGEITHVGINFPEPGKYKISVWEVETYTLLTQITIKQGHEPWSVREIPRLTVSRNKTYAICAFMPIGITYYSISNLELPKEVQEIKILDSVAAFGDNYPVDQVIENALFGFMDFKFVAFTP